MYIVFYYLFVLNIFIQIFFKEDFSMMNKDLTRGTIYGKAASDQVILTNLVYRDRFHTRSDVKKKATRKKKIFTNELKQKIRQNAVRYFIKFVKVVSSVFSGAVLFTFLFTLVPEMSECMPNFYKLCYVLSHTFDMLLELL